MGLRKQELPTTEGDIPPPSPEFVALGVFMAACHQVGDRLERGDIRPREYKKALREEMDRAWRQAEASVGVLRMRSPAYDREMARCVRQGKAWFDQLERMLDAAQLMRK